MLSFARRALPVVAGLLALGPASAQEPFQLPLSAVPPAASVALPYPNQQLADAVAQQLRAGGQLEQFQIQVTCRDGTVVLDGQVRDLPQRDEAARLTQSVPGVARVLNRLQVGESGAVRADRPVARTQFALSQEPVPPPRRAEPAPLRGDAESFPGAQEPLPSYRADPGFSPFSQPPPLPPYAWPTYAPFNNYSRVAYPQAYPYESFPYMGPFHPFPKVPLGWRNVRLQWDDGHWWLSTHAQKRDWWVLRYW